MFAGLCRVKAIGIIQRHLQRAQRLPHRVYHVARQRCGGHDLPLTHKQRIARHLPQAVQGMADCRLGQVQLLRGAADAAFAVNGFKDDKEIQIDS